MICNKCGSSNVQVQAVTTTKVKRRGFFRWLLWILLALFTFGLVLLIPLLTNSKVKTKVHSEALCQSCGTRWRV